MNIVKSSVDGLERFNPSNAERFRLPARAAEVAELKHYQNFFKLIQLALTLPAMCCERTFSAMRRVWSYLRSTMTEACFTSLSLLYIEGGLSLSTLCWKWKPVPADAWNSLPRPLRGIAVASTLKSELFFQAYGVSTIASTVADPWDCCHYWLMLFTLTICVLSSF